MLTPEGYKSRLVEKQFDEYMQTFGAVCIEGPKYCGKTWTARSRAKSAAFVGNPENNFQTRTMAQISPVNPIIVSIIVQDFRVVFSSISRRELTSQNPESFT